MSAVADAAGALALLVGALLCLTSAIGLLRLSGVYARMHAASKPQALGVLLVLLGLALRLRDPGSLGMLVVAALFQMLTIPVSAHLLARAARASEVTDPADPTDDTAAGGPDPADPADDAGNPHPDSAQAITATTRPGARTEGGAGPVPGTARPQPRRGAR